MLKLHTQSCQIIVRIFNISVKMMDGDGMVICLVSYGTCGMCVNTDVI